MRIWKRLLLRLAKIVNVLLVTASIMLLTVSYITRMGGIVVRMNEADNLYGDGDD